MTTGTFGRRALALTGALAIAASCTVVGASGAWARDRHGSEGQEVPSMSSSESSTESPSTSMSMATPQRGRGPLASLVADGTITAEQARTVMAAVHDAAEAHHGTSSHDGSQLQADRTTALAGLVSSGVMTQAQADAIAAADRDGLRALLTAGTVTRAQLGALKDALASLRDERKAAAQSAHTSSQATVLAGLVADGTLTSAQSTAIAAALAARPQQHHGRH